MNALSQPSAGRPYAEVIGDPIAQSKSPAIHGFWLAELDIAADYCACHVTPDGLAAYIAQRRGDGDWRGCNVTMPHKQAILPLLDRLDPVARRIGAVNTVVREADGSLTGYNTDAPGFWEPLAPLFTTHDGARRALVLGNGGAARALVVALADAGLSITLAGRDPAKAQALLDELAPSANHMATSLAQYALPGPARFDLVANASPLGMMGNPPLEFALSHVFAGGIVDDIVTAPLETPLLLDARKAGFVTIDGLAMLIGQAAVAFAHFFGQSPPRADGDARLRLILTGKA